jgi:hypothetical protein
MDGLSRLLKFSIGCLFNVGSRWEEFVIPSALRSGRDEVYHSGSCDPRSVVVLQGVLHSVYRTNRIVIAVPRWDDAMF